MEQNKREYRSHGSRRPWSKMATNMGNFPKRCSPIFSFATNDCPLPKVHSNMNRILPPIQILGDLVDGRGHASYGVTFWG